MKKRLFIAIDVPKKIKAKITSFQNHLKTEIQEAVWVKQDNIHLTLVFIGDIDYNQIPEIISRLNRLQDDVFEVSFSEIGGFPSQNKAHTLYLGFKENLALYYLQEKIRKRLEKLGIMIGDKEFVPHLTIVRFKRPKNLEKLKLPIENLGKFSVKEFVLYESELKSDGPKHTPIKKFYLS